MIIRIFIRSITGGSLPLHVHNFNSVLEVKKMIQDKDDVPVSSQQLMLGGENLEDNHTLDDYGIESNNVIDLVTVYKTNIKLYVTTMTGRSFILQAKSSDTIETIKETISIIVGAVPENQILTSGGKLLAEPGTLADHKIFTDSSIMVTVCLRGSSDTSVLQLDDTTTNGSNGSLKVTSWDSAQDATKQLYNLKGVSTSSRRPEFKAVKISSFSQHYKIHGNTSLNMIYHVQGGSSRIEDPVDEAISVNVGYPTYYNMTEKPLNWNQPYTVRSVGNNNPLMSLSGCTFTEETDWVTDTVS